MKTTKILYEDTYCTECEAVVQAIKYREDRLWVCLDRTVFYPEGGGQPCDLGSLEWREPSWTTCESEGAGSREDGSSVADDRIGVHHVSVVDVQEEGEVIWHRLELSGGSEADSLREGMTVRCRIDWERRLDLMRQHTGEHIVSGLIHERFGYDNVGFHLSMDTMTIDLSGELTWEDLWEIEAAANCLVRQNVPVEILYPSPEELQRIPYRSKKELTGAVRIVRVPDGDTCACCGTHVSRTGEIGMVKLTAMQKWKAGVRVWLCCGSRAEEYCRMLQKQNRQISAALSAKPEETAAAVERVMGELAGVKSELTSWKYRLYDEIAGANADRENIILFEENFSMEDLRHLADRLMKVCSGCCLVFSGKDGEGYRYAVGSKSVDVRPLVREMNGELAGRGGGKPQMAQGTLQAGRAGIEAFLREKRAGCLWE